MTAGYAQLEHESLQSKVPTSEGRTGDILKKR